MSQLPFFKYCHVFSGPVKLMIKETHAIFSTIPRAQNDLSKANVITVSRRYRSVLHECIDNLSKDIEIDHSEQINTFQDIEIIWNLCEILLLDANPTGTLIIQLKNWIKTYFESIGSEGEAILASISESSVKHTDLYELSQRFIEIFKSKDPNRKYRAKREQSSDLDNIIISAFEYDLIQVIAACCSYLDDNWWFVTHFIDLLHCSGQLKNHDIIEPDKLRENFLQDYSSTLFDNDQLWAIGVSYLDRCTQYGTSYLEILLARIPLDLDDEDKVHKIISLAKKRGLTSTINSVSLLMARKWISKCPRLSDESLKVTRNSKDVQLPTPVMLSNSLYWAVKSGDTLVTTYVSDQCLYYYCKTGSFPEMSVFESLKRLPLDNERLAFLAKYYEFKTKISSKDLSDSDLGEAGNLIKALIASKIYPKFISSELLRDVNFLLGLDPQMVLPTDKTLELMRSIEEISNEAKINEELELRRGLVRNLARTLIRPISGDK